MGVAKEQLDDGKTEVRSILDTEGIVVTDDEIEESLWYYYYDVDKTVNYLRGMWSFVLGPLSCIADPPASELQVRKITNQRNQRRRRRY